MKQFHDLDSLPMEIDMSYLDGKGGIEETFLKHKAKWNKSSYQKFNTTKLNHIISRKRKSIGNEKEPVYEFWYSILQIVQKGTLIYQISG